MNIQQLRALCEVVRHNLKVSVAADSLSRLQPVVSRQIREFEDELGVQLFVRSKNRLSGLTPAGREIYAAAEQVLRELNSLRSAAEEHSAPNHGNLVISTTHTHARYTLPDVITTFCRDFPRVRISLRQGKPMEALERVRTGEADVAICALPRTTVEGVASIPVYRIAWDVVVSATHPLLKKRNPTLEDVAQYPIITNDPSFSGQRILNEALSRTGKTPSLFLEGVDADVSKAYVERGQAVAILARVTYEPERDRSLRVLNLQRHFRPSVLAICLRRNVRLRSYIVNFIQRFAPHLHEEAIHKAVDSERGDPRYSTEKCPFLVTRSA